MLDVKVYFKKKGQLDEQSYHLSIQHGAAAFFLIFQDIGISSSEKCKATADSLHLVVVRQSRWIYDTSDSVEPPGGQTEQDETPQESAWREAREEIGEALFDTLCNDFTPRPVVVSDAVAFFPASIGAQENASAAYQAFACVVPVTSLQLAEIRLRLFTSAQSGIDGEQTRPDLISLSGLIECANDPLIAHTAIEFLRCFGVAVPPRKTVSTLPYPL